MRIRVKESVVYLLIAVLLIMTIGYAYLTSQLNINGSSHIHNPVWDIHFDNVQVLEGSVTADEPVIEDDQITVTYQVSLQKPGDFFEFTVDVVNAGTIDAMIDTISSKMNDVEIEELPKWLLYSVTYSDNIFLEEKQELNAGETETVKVRVEYNKDLSASELPSDVQNIEFLFQITYVQKTDESITRDRAEPLYGVLANELSSGRTMVYTGSHKDSMNGVGTRAIYYWHADTDEEAQEILEKNNVIFGDFCWKIIRTTDTGGTKLLYNGVANEGTCNTSRDYIGPNGAVGTNLNKYNLSDNDLAYVGYMFNTDYFPVNYGYEDIYYPNDDPEMQNASLYGKNVSYQNGHYTLIDTIADYGPSDSRHYTCLNQTGVCDTIRYYYYGYYYVEWQGASNVEEYLHNLLAGDSVNRDDSQIKSFIDNWYQTNLLSYGKYIEDTVYCNDRSFSDIGGWNPNGSLNGYPKFNGYNLSGDLSCPNETDQFSVSNPKAKLTYPIALMTAPELYLLGNDKLRKGTNIYWLMTPSHFHNNNGANTRVITFVGGISFSTVGTNSLMTIRPAISLKPDVQYIHGDGSVENPYLVRYD